MFDAHGEYSLNRRSSRGEKGDVGRCKWYSGGFRFSSSRRGGVELRRGAGGKLDDRRKLTVV